MLPNHCSGSAPRPVRQRRQPGTPVTTLLAVLGAGLSLCVSGCAPLAQVLPTGPLSPEVTADPPAATDEMDGTEETQKSSAGGSGESHLGQDHTAPAPSQQRDPALPRAGEWRDLSSGGTCDPDENVTVSVAGSGAVIRGACGTVVVSGSDVIGNIDSAERVEISGTNSTLIGNAWGDAQVSGDNVTVEVTRLGSLTSRAAGTQVTSNEVTSLIFVGDGGVLDAGAIDRLVLAGDGASVKAHTIIDSLAITGAENAVEWSTGLTAATLDTGSSTALIPPLS